MKRLLSLFFVSFIFAPLSLLAFGIRIVDQDAAATARGDAFVATADNPSAIYYNPAGITQIDGLTARLGVYAIGLHVHYSPEDDGDGLETKEKTLFVPQFYTTYKPPVGPFTLGLGVYSPYGLELDYPDTAPFRTLAKFGKVNFGTINPVIAMQVTRTLSVAFGATIDVAEVDLRRGIEFPPAASFLNGKGNEFKFRGEGTTAGFNAGIFWKPTEQHAFGVSYHSGVTIDFSGHSSAHLSDTQIAAARRTNEKIRMANSAIAQIKATVPPAFQQAALARFGLPSEPIAEIPTSFPEEDADAKIRFPQFLMAGYSFRPTQKWNFEADVDWADWDVLNTVTLHQQRSGDVRLPFNWKHSWMFEFGATHYFDWQGMRASAGYVYSENSVPNDSFNPQVPDSNRHIFSAGFGQTLHDFSWDLGYQLAYGPTRTINNDTLADGRYQFISHAVTLSLGYHY